MSTFAIATLGCKVNSYESEYYHENLVLAGFQPTKFSEIADIYLINTCCLTDVAVSKSKKLINRAKRLNPVAFIVVVGCLVQVYRQEVDKLAGVDLVCGSAGKKDLVKLITENYTKKQTKALRIEAPFADFEDLTINDWQKTRAFLKIQDGCNQHCSYCIIPQARGPHRSADITQILASAEKLSEKHREIVLVGIHTGHFGNEKATNLCALLKELAKLPNLQRIRLSSIEMTEISDELIDLMANERKIARHLHIPLQSGCTAILQVMNRPYEANGYLERLQTIKSCLPGISISSDIMVGFPGETEDKWQASYQTILACDFSFLHVFPYSARANTGAATMKNQVAPLIKKQRVTELLAYSQRQHEKYQRKFVGKEVEVLVETGKDNWAFGHSSEYLPIEISGTASRNELVKVKINNYSDHHLIAERIT